MAKKEDNYAVELTLEMVITKEGSDEAPARDFHNSNYKMEWTHMDYMQLVAVQQAIAQLGQILVDMGWADAAVIGFDREAIEAAKVIAQGSI